MGWFGPSQNEIWSQIARDIGGDYVESGFLQKGALRYRHNNWEILLDTYTDDTGEASSTYTRMRSPFISQDDFTFRLYRENIFSGLGKTFGLTQDIKIGDPCFDDQFVIQSNDSQRVAQLLAAPRLKSLIQQQPRIRLEIKTKDGFWSNALPEGVHELYFMAGGIIKETALLQLLFELFGQTLEQLVEMNVAAAVAPNVRLE